MLPHSIFDSFLLDVCIIDQISDSPYSFSFTPSRITGDSAMWGCFYSSLITVPAAGTSMPCETYFASHFLTISQQEGQRLKLTDAEYAFMVRYGPQNQYKIQIQR